MRRKSEVRGGEVKDKSTKFWAPTFRAPTLSLPPSFLSASAHLEHGEEETLQITKTAAKFGEILVAKVGLATVGRAPAPQLPREEVDEW